MFLQWANKNKKDCAVSFLFLKPLVVKLCFCSVTNGPTLSSLFGGRPDDLSPPLSPDWQQPSMRRQVAAARQVSVSSPKTLEHSSKQFLEKKRKQ